MTEQCDSKQNNHMEVSANQLDNNVFSIATTGCQEVTDSSGDLCDAGVSSQFPSNYNQPPAIDRLLLRTNQQIWIQLDDIC